MQSDDANQRGISLLRAARSGRDDRGPAAVSGRTVTAGSPVARSSRERRRSWAGRHWRPRLRQRRMPWSRRHRRLDGRRLEGRRRSRQQQGQRFRRRRHVPRAQRGGVPRERLTPIPPRPVPAKWDYECEICVVGAGGAGSMPRRARPSWARTSSASRPWPARRQRAVGRHVRYFGRIEAAGVEALRLPRIPVRRAQAHRLGHGRIPLRGRPAPHLPHSRVGRPVHRLDGRLRRAMAPGRGARVCGAEELHAGPSRAQDEGRHRRHVQLRPAPRRGLPLPVPGRGARAGRRRAHRGRRRPRGLRARGLHPRHEGGHPHGRRLLQQQGPAQGIHSHGGHGLRVQLPGGRRDGRVLPHGARRGRRTCPVSTARPRSNGGVDWEAEGRPVGALPLRRHDAAVAPAVVHRRPLRQPPALHGQPREEGRRRRHLRAGRPGHHPDDASGPSRLHHLRRQLRRPPGRLRAGTLAASSSRPTWSRSTRCPNTTATGTTACRTPSMPTC